MIVSKRGIEETPQNFRIAEQALLDELQADSVFWSGRAATGLYHAYQLAKIRRPDVTEPEVIVPAVMCATAANTALISDMTPRFADVGAETGLMTLDTIKARFSKNTIAVVVIHLLGNCVDIEPIAVWCKENNLLLIEDPTQALGARLPGGELAGSAGDVTIYSFNSTKIIGAGNGVLISHDKRTTDVLCQIIEAGTAFPDIDDNIRLQLALSYRNLHHSLVGLLRLNNLAVQQISDSFMAVRSAYEPLYLRPVNPDIDLNAAWEALPASLEHRLNMANIYSEKLSGHSEWTLLKGFQASGVCWRFSLLINQPEQQVAFSEAVRRDGFHVSNLYWATNQFFNPGDVCEGADYFSRRIVNLWVDTSVDTDYVARCCDSLLRHSNMLKN